MEAEKVCTVCDWPVSSSHKGLKRFLGFTNFYRRFVQNFSSVAVPLMVLMSSKIPFKCSPGAQAAFNELKQWLTTAPILILLDPKKQFIVEVDASDSRLGGVLSQWGKDNKVLSRAFFSKPLSPAERNYSVGDRELLAIKLALEEWRNWLEGASVPFIVWTDHCNLEYLQSAKCLNPHQARWAMFLARFNFMFPGNKNGKPDALS